MNADPDNTDEDETPQIEAKDVSRSEHKDFDAEVERLSRDAENMRLTFMKRHRSRGHFSMSLGLISLTAGAAGFGWYLLVEADILRAAGSMLLAICIPVILYIWHDGIIKSYKRSYKREFLPRLAHALGGFKFHPARGIGRKIIARTGLIPKFDVYEAEDCFIGRYKGVKVLFSEARLKHKKGYLEPIFDGVIVLLEVPNATIKGHTILTADNQAYRQWRGTRWKKLQDVTIKTGNEQWDRFDILSDQPEAAKQLIGERLLKELSEAADIFDNSPLSAAFFKGRFVFLMIPYKGDMFEASNIHVPVATKQHAMQCKREIEQILEIIDVFELYQKTGKKPDARQEAAQKVDETPQEQKPNPPSENNEDPSKDDAAS